MSVSSRVVYLHGFASSPESRKARFLSERLQRAGFSVDVPDLAAGDFSKLTITGQLQIVDQTIHGDAATLIGSSLGGYLAAIYAAQHSNIQKLVLLAPALGFYQLWTSKLTEAQLATWKQRGAIPVFHYGMAREVPLHYEFLGDAGRYPAVPSFQQPALIFHGRNDPVVPITSSEEFTRTHPNAQLISLPSGHELTDVLEEIWRETQAFLQG